MINTNTKHFNDIKIVQLTFALPVKKDCSLTQVTILVTKNHISIYFYSTK